MLLRVMRITEEKTMTRKQWVMLYHSTAIWLQTEYIAHNVHVEHNWLLNFFLVLFFIYGFQGATHFLFILFI